MNRIAELARGIARAANESGRTQSAIVREILMLRVGGGQLGFTEYFDYQLYRNDLSRREKSAFIGWRKHERLAEILVDDLSIFLSLDKLTTYALFRGYSLPYPPIKGIFGRRCPRDFCHSIETNSELEKFLRTESNYPIYLKPSHSSYGKGNALLHRFDGQCVVLGDDSRIPVDRLCGSLSEGYTRLGWLLQEPLSPHPDIERLCGEKISGVRVCSFMTPKGPKVFRAVWKINVGGRDSDNFHHGASGNMLADVEVESGRITRVVQGIGFDQKVDPVHPVTGKELVGVCLPWWDEVVRVVTDAHHVFPGFISPGWDVAICEQGVVILEMNGFGDVDLTQHVGRRGFLDGEFLDYLDSRDLRDSARTVRPGRRSRSKTGNWRRSSQQHWPWW